MLAVLSHWPSKSVACHKIYKKTSACVKSHQDWVLGHHGASQSTMEQPGHHSSSVLLLLNAEHELVKPKEFGSERSVETTNIWWSISPRDVKTSSRKTRDWSLVVQSMGQPAQTSQISPIWFTRALSLYWPRPPWARSLPKLTALPPCCPLSASTLSPAPLDALVKWEPPWPGGQTLCHSTLSTSTSSYFHFPFPKWLLWFNSSVAAQEQPRQLEQAGNIMGDVFTFPSTVSAAPTVDKSSELRF